MNKFIFMLLKRSFYSLMLLSVVLLNMAFASPINVKATIEAGTCDVFVNTAGADISTLGSANEKLVLNPVSPADLLQGKQPVNLKAVTLQLSNCSGGRGSNSEKPALIIRAGAGGGIVSGEPHLFREASSSADKRIGVVVAKSENPGDPGTGWANYVSSGETVYLSSQSVSIDDANSEVMNKNFWLGTSCGTEVQCAAGGGASLTGGNVNAKMVFEFKYK